MQKLVLSLFFSSFSFKGVRREGHLFFAKFLFVRWLIYNKVFNSKSNFKPDNSKPYLGEIGGESRNPFWVSNPDWHVEKSNTLCCAVTVAFGWIVQELHQEGYIGASLILTKYPFHI